MAKIPVSDTVLYFHLPVMIILALAMYAAVRWKHRISRPTAFILLGIYAAYLAAMVAVPSLAM